MTYILLFKCPSCSWDLGLISSRNGWIDEHESFGICMKGDPGDILGKPLGNILVFVFTMSSV